VLTEHSATIHETRSERAKDLQELAAIAKQGMAIQQKQNEFIAERVHELQEESERQAMEISQRTDKDAQIHRVIQGHRARTLRFSVPMFVSMAYASSCLPGWS
jgi:recombinational DNA repair ATPase RecF